MSDAYYEPDWPIRESEETRFCGPCDTDTWHTIRQYRWTVERECSECGGIEEVDDL